MAKEVEGCLDGDRGVQKAGAGSGSAWGTGKLVRVRSTSRLRLSRSPLLVRGHGQILHSVPGILYLQLLYLLHRDVKIIKGDNRFESTSEKKYFFGEGYYLTVENMLCSS